MEGRLDTIRVFGSLTPDAGLGKLQGKACSLKKKGGLKKSQGGAIKALGSLTKEEV